MPKPKQFLKENKKKSKHAAQVPTTADEYLAAGVDFEEAGEKWRGGDAAKSTRFFVRAIDCYDEALKKFPHSFDLAYNKARLQYELTQHPKLIQQLPGTLLELLQTAIESSRYALKLNEQNADVLFNTAQALTSYVEALQESDTPDATDPLPLLEQSLDLFQQCLTRQELQHQEFQEQEAAASTLAQDNDNEDGGVPLTSTSSMDIDTSSSTPSTPPQDDRWATIVEPVTNDSLLDTLLAQLSTLSTLISLLPIPTPPSILDFITTYASPILTKLPLYTPTTTRESEVTITHSDYTVASTDLQFRNNLLPLSTYSQTLTTAYALPNLTTNPEALVKSAESRITFYNAVRSHPDGFQKDALHACWEALSQALDSLAKASKLPDVENLAKIHITRGDVEMLRWRMGRVGVGYDAAVKYATALLKNAEVFYRGGKNEARLRGLEAVEIEGKIKEAIIRGLRGEGGTEGVLGEVGQENAARVVGEMVEEGLVGREELSGIGIMGF